MRFKTSKLLRESKTKTNETNREERERERERERDGDANFDDGVFPNDDDVPEFFDEKRE